MNGERAGRQVLILAPMRMELTPFVRALRLNRGSLAGAEVYTGRTAQLGIVATTAGVGMAAAANTTARLLGAAPFDWVVVSGIAGGVSPAIAIGAVIVPELVRDHAGNEYRAHALGELAQAGTVLTGDELITDPGRLTSLEEEGVVALDMETAAVARVCEQHGCRWSAVRSISDRPHDGTLDAGVVELLKPDGSVDGPRALRYIVTHPHRVPNLVRLARDAGSAATAAARTTISACARLGDPEVH